MKGVNIDEEKHFNGCINLWNSYPRRGCCRHGYGSTTTGKSIYRFPGYNPTVYNKGRLSPGRSLPRERCKCSYLSPCSDAGSTSAELLRRPDCSDYYRLSSACSRSGDRSNGFC